MHRCHDMVEVGGSVVRAFSRALVYRLVSDCERLEVHACQEGALPRQPFRIALLVDSG
jgi:hypothetical protein